MKEFKATLQSTVEHLKVGLILLEQGLLLTPKLLDIFGELPCLLALCVGSNTIARRRVDEKIVNRKKNHEKDFL